MKVQINTGWAIGQFLIPSSTVLDYGNKGDHELTPFETVAKGLVPPIDSCALDADAAFVLHRAYPFYRERLHRRLDAFQEETFQTTLLAG